MRLLISTQMFRFNFRYFVLALALFVLEVLIAVFAHDQFIRPFVGDVLVVILIYCSIKSILSARVIPTAIFVLLFAYTLEVLQYFNIVEVLRLQHSRIARIVIGTTFEWTDLIAYTLGIGLVLILEKKIKPNKI